MHVNLTHNDNIKTFDDVARHVKLEEDRLHVGKLINEDFIYEIKMRGVGVFIFSSVRFLSKKVTKPN
jgi:hypothetical protein